MMHCCALIATMIALWSAGSCSRTAAYRLSSSIVHRLIASSQLSSASGDSLPLSVGNNSTTPPPAVIKVNATEFHKVGEEVVYHGKYRKIINKKIKFPNKDHIDFEILTQGCPSVVVFCWDRKTATTTLLKEYHPGPERLHFGTVAGMYEPKKHSSPLECAQFELEEEAHLFSSNWIPLLETPETSASFDKYSDNHFYPFLALDCEPVANPRALDKEEYIEIVRGVSYDKLLEYLYSGQINVASSYGILMGLRKLEQLHIDLRKPSSSLD